MVSAASSHQAESDGHSFCTRGLPLVAADKFTAFALSNGISSNKGLFEPVFEPVSSSAVLRHHQHRREQRMRKTMSYRSPQTDTGKWPNEAFGERCEWPKSHSVKVRRTEWLSVFSSGEIGEFAENAC